MIRGLLVITGCCFVLLDAADALMSPFVFQFCFLSCASLSLYFQKASLFGQWAALSKHFFRITSFLAPLLLSLHKCVIFFCSALLPTVVVSEKKSRIQRVHCTVYTHFLHWAIELVSQTHAQAIINGSNNNTHREHTTFSSPVFPWLLSLAFSTTTTIYPDKMSTGCCSKCSMYVLVVFCNSSSNVGNDAILNTLCPSAVCWDSLPPFETPSQLFASVCVSGRHRDDDDD